MEIYLTPENAINAVRDVKQAAKLLGVLDISNEVLDNEDFSFWTGSSEPKAHHYGKHGLILHTREVIRNGMSIIKENYDLHGLTEEDVREFFLSSLFHDYGKLFDYERADTHSGYGDYCNVHEGWRSTDHKRKIHHISRSAIFFSECAKKHGLDKDLTDRVLHNILSHHGCREFGSPVSPNSRIAWILHLSDMISARLYDCETLDRYK